MNHVHGVTYTSTVCYAWMSYTPLQTCVLLMYHVQPYAYNNNNNITTNSSTFNRMVKINVITSHLSLQRVRGVACIYTCPCAGNMYPRE